MTKELVPAAPPSDAPEEAQHGDDLTTIVGIDKAMRRVMGQMSSGLIDPVMGNLLLKSYEIIREDILKSLRLKNEEAFSESKKNQIDAELESELILFIDDYRALKRAAAKAEAAESEVKPEVKSETAKPEVKSEVRPETDLKHKKNGKA